MPREEMGGERSRDRGRDKARDKGRDKTRRRGLRRRICRFCADTKVGIDYKDTQVLRYFITERGKVVPRRITGNCAWHQRLVALAIRRARVIALLPFTVVE